MPAIDSKFLLPTGQPVHRSVGAILDVHLLQGAVAAGGHFLGRVTVVLRRKGDVRRHCGHEQLAVRILENVPHFPPDRCQIFALHRKARHFQRALLHGQNTHQQL